MKHFNIRTIVAGMLASSMLLAPMGSVSAEELRISVKNQAERGQQADLPTNGLSEESVRNRWGQPESMTGPVGEPPISQWYYSDFVVYFEGNRVIHSVLKPQR